MADTYSFLTVAATLRSVDGISISLGAGAGVAEEGITIEFEGDKNTLTGGADGEAMNSLAGPNLGRATVRLLKTSPINQDLMQLYNAQKANPAVWGLNQLTVSDIARGDVINGTIVAFRRPPNLTYAKVAGMNEWTFDIGNLQQNLGSGV